jgi:hypothetical protein
MMTREELDEHNRIEDAKRRDLVRERIEALRAAFEEQTQAYRKREFPMLGAVLIEVMAGPKYVRFVRVDGSSRSAMGFVELATGAIYYPKGWAGPTKNHVRGNVFADDYGLSAFGRYGVKTLR